MNDYAVQLLIRMLKIYSPSGKEKVIADFLAKEMKKLGFHVRQDEVGNVIGEIGQVKEWNEMEGKIFVHGELWNAESDTPLAKGDKVVIQSVEGLTLKVKPISDLTSS